MPELAQSAVFEWVALELEQGTPFNRLTARGTVRLVLREMGLDPRTLTRRQATVVLSRPPFKAALEHRGVPSKDAAHLIEALVTRLESAPIDEAPQSHDSPEDIFGRFVPE